MLSTSYTLCIDMRNVHLLLPPEKIVLNLCGSIFLVFFVFITIRKKLLNGLPAFMLFYMNYHTHTHNPGFFIDILFLSCVFFFFFLFYIIIQCLPIYFYNTAYFKLMLMQPDKIFSVLFPIYIDVHVSCVCVYVGYWIE